ncbi:Leucine-rich repeat protein kinase family protein isoform 2 [Hibiscus syriacus]|uniref:Leucine-rich repeat protein kinase family protein isoform 2 n=1 Tax=Hibiscus syriacus TaxID=106335 RepID=A0A6A2WJ56_HIBSY|nr:Leucine-rich repeat protein kinase family protein isoform 2 [Hibiscus syriacus]
MEEDESETWAPLKSIKISFTLSMEAQRSALSIFLLAVILFLIQCAVAQKVGISSPIERRAMLDLRASLGLRGKDWPIKADPCSSLLGVECRNRSVSNITVSGLRRTIVGRLNPRFSVDPLVNLTRLVSFNASGFPLPGSIPDWFGNRLANLEVLVLQSCTISGSIPGTLGNLSRLTSLHLHDNNLAGSIPATLGQLRNLKIFDLSINSLTGSIPSSFGSLGNIERLQLASNYLSGSIPPSLGSLKGLQVFNVSDNNLSGSIPSQFGNLSWLVELDLSKNSLYGSMPEELKKLRGLRKMIMGGNELKGNLPIDLFSSLVELQVVDLSRNKLDGDLSGAIWSMPKLQSFDVSSNNFTGPFPSLHSNTSVSTVAVLNLSKIFFYGTLKFSLGMFKFIDLSSNYFQGKDQATPPPAESSSKSRKRLIFTLAGVIGGLGFIVILVLVLVRILRCNKGIGNQSGSADVVPQLPKDPTNLAGSGDPFTYEQLLLATDNFNETNLIKQGHSGDLFRESFLTADLSRSWGTAWNMKLTNFWLKIANGAAEGLFHLHHECNPSLVHRDVQASSILLDDKFEVRFGSLSEVRVQEGDTHQNVLSRLLRKPQTSEPGSSGSGSLSTTCAYDVYCFGKVLLELITGKPGIGKAEDASTKEWLEQSLACISTYEKELVTKIMDPSLIVDEDLLEEVWAMAIVARSCINPKPSKRPSMKHVLKALENPLKVVREESFSSGRLRTTSSRRSWGSAFFGSWRKSSLESATVPGHQNREGFSGFWQ